MRDYSKIPYRKCGLDETGVDCWGLVRLVYRDELGIELPAFPEQDGDSEAMAERVALEQERWAKVETPCRLDAIVIRVDGMPKHVAVCLGGGMMMHALDGAGVVTERMDSAKWKHRVAGVYRYAGGAIEISGCPHPLRTTRIESLSIAGLSLKKMIHHAMVSAGWAHPEKVRGMAWVDGVPVPREAWAETMPLAGSRVEFRIVPGSGSTGRLIGMLAVVGLSIAAAAFTGGLSVFATGGALAGYGGIAAGLAGAAVSMAGSLLVNAIFPVRPSLARNPGTAEAQNLLSGAQNSATKYGAIPVVLGRYRFAAPLAANTYAETNATTSYLRVALCWGYGPLQVSDIRIGDTSIASLADMQIQTLTGSSSDSSAAKQAFNKIYGRDVIQVAPSVELTCKAFESVAWVRASNVITVTTPTVHGFSVGTMVHLQYILTDAITEIVDSVTFRVPHVGVDGSGSTYCAGSDWTERVLASDVDQIQVTLHFPEGLRQMPVEGGNAGKIDPAPFVADVQVRQLDSETLLPIAPWWDVHRAIPGETITIQPARYQLDSDAELEPVYQWTRISVDEHGKIIARTGAPTLVPTSEPSGSLLSRLQADTYGVDIVFSRLPDLGDGEEHIWDICIHGDDVYEAQDKRSAGIAGCALTMAGLEATVADGVAERADIETVKLGADGQPYYKRKDAFSHSVTFNVARGSYEVRARRVNDSETTFYYPSGNEGRKCHACQLLAITGFSNTKPITPPKPLAMTAIRVKATDQLSGSIDAITATCTSICKDWDHTTSTWITRATRNPASLYRYVLQHPANARRCADSQIDLTALATWHDYCRTNGFMSDSVVTSQQSLMDVLRDICAAGRSTPHYVDGRWTVCTDKPRTSIAQCFTPHNSWGFEGVRSFPDVPHAFRVTFANALRGYQDDEMLVYDDGYGPSNATLIEALTLPGVTTPAAVHKHARFHLAQLHLRPETYSLNCDFEHLICTKGDLVRAVHDVPMWGIGSGRIKRFISGGLTLELDNDMPMDGGTRYTIRIRRSDGQYVTPNVAPKPIDGYYSFIDLEWPISEFDGAAGNLFLFGELGQASVECIVQSIEPGDNHSARLTLVDYSPEIYNSDTQPIPDFDSQITRPPNVTIRSVTVRPVIASIISDERALTQVGPGQFGNTIRASWHNPSTMPGGISGVEGQIDFAGDGRDSWRGRGSVLIGSGIYVFDDVLEGVAYRIRLRYVTTDGRTGPWSNVVTHTVVGKTNPPSVVTGMRCVMVGNRVQLDWDDNEEIDVAGYEVRINDDGWDSGWGTGGHVFRGAASTCVVDPPSGGSNRRWSVRAYDTGGRYCQSSASVEYTALLPASPANLRGQVVDNMVQLSWTAPATTTLPVAHFHLKRGATWAGADDIGTKAGAFTTVQELQAGTYTYWVATVDSGGFESAPASVSVRVDSPPDYVSHGQYVATWTGTKTNARAI